MSTSASSLKPPLALDYAAMVLMVDDQPMIGEAIRRLLVGEPDIGYHYCSNPTEAMNLVELFKPTVILQDLVMPQIDGLTLVREFRSNPSTFQTPIIVLSTKEEAQIKSDAFTAGANDYLVKLPDRIELLARIRYHSRACVNQIQRDEAFRALHRSQQELVKSNSDLRIVNQRLRAASAQVQQLQGLLPICSYCKRIRDDQDYWSQLETYIAARAGIQFSHGICPPCAKTHFGVDVKGDGPGSSQETHCCTPALEVKSNPSSDPHS